MIPKIIHYCWFGRRPLPELAQKCIASWQKFLPDYEIKRWDESNFDLNACAYVQEAYHAKRWAFVSDYARFAILYQYGGSGSRRPSQYGRAGSCLPSEFCLSVTA